MFTLMCGSQDGSSYKQGDISRAAEPSSNITGEEVIIALFRIGHHCLRRLFLVCRATACNSTLFLNTYVFTNSVQTSLLQ